MITEIEPRVVHAPELYGAAWLNGPPVLLREQEGRVVLLDFWDYTSVNCLRSLPYIKEWDSVYQDAGLLTVGVHTPEFEFASSESLVAEALSSLDVPYPVVLDNNGTIWSAYANRIWPTRTLIDRQGFVRFSQNGDRGYQEFERAIQILLRDSGYHGELPPLMEALRAEDAPGAICNRATSEIQGGYLRGALGNVEGFSPESAAAYTDPGLYLPGRFYLHGTWWSNRESVRFDGPEGGEGMLSFPYEAKDVNAVLRSDSGNPVDVIVEQDGRPVPNSALGGDVRRTESGTTVLHVVEPRMYRLVTNGEFGAHVLRLRISSPGLDVFALSFTTSLMNPEFSSN